jgi:hypothetical protein
MALGVPSNSDAFGGTGMERHNIALVTAVVALIAIPPTARPEAARVEAGLKNPPVIGRTGAAPGGRMLAAPRDLFVARCRSSIAMGRYGIHRRADMIAFVYDPTFPTRLKLHSF